MIFISHKTDPDHEYAKRIAKILKDKKIDYFMAPESIKGGKDFSFDVPKAINCCEIFLLILTKNTHKSNHVRKEVAIAISHKKHIIPLKIGEFDLDDSFEYLLANIQIIQFDFEKELINKLVESCKLGEKVIEIEIEKNPSKKIVLMKGDFQDNLHNFLIENPNEFNKTVFAIGIDNSSLLSISSNKGILKWVCKYLFEEYNITQDYLQDLINDAKQIQLHHKTKNEGMDYKDSVIISFPLKIVDGIQTYMNLLLIANSKKTSSFKYTKDLDDVEGIDSREIVMEIFNRVQNAKKYNNLFLGAIGTNGLNFPYEVIVSEILNCYVYSRRINVMPNNLYLSMRIADMEKFDVTYDKIISYIETVLDFMK